MYAIRVRFLFCSLVALHTLAIASCEAPAPTLESAGPLVDLVDPTIGTGGFAFAYGGAFLGAAAPHGLVKAGPDTTGSFGEIRFVHTSGNWADDPTILCFSHLHLHGTGLPEAGVVAMMPTSSFVESDPRAVDYAATRVDEVAKPGVYAVRLAEPNIFVELAAPTPYVAHHRITYAQGATKQLVVDLFRTIVEGVVTEATWNVDTNAHTIAGSLHTEGSLSPAGGYDVHFMIESLADFTHVDTEFGATLTFASDGPVELRVALSYTDLDGARANLAASEARTFDDAARAAHDAWNALLSRVNVECSATSGCDPRDTVVFASALYRSFLMPTIMSDVDGRWRTPLNTVESADGFRMMTDMSLWDTYRTVHPLYALVAHESARDAALSIARFTEVTGTAPLWTMATGDASVMVGSPAEVVLADALSRGAITSSDLEGAWPVLRAAALDAEDPPQGRNGRNDVMAYDAMGGWVPSPLRGPVSKTLEYAIADQALARIARALGHDDDATHLETRARGWRELFDPETKFLRARDESGAFVTQAADFAPEEFADDYVEADAWQSTFPYDDIAGISEVYGSTANAIEKISDMFALTQSDWDTRDTGAATFGVEPLPFQWQGNEPSMHVPSLAFDLGDAALGTQFVTWVMDNQYGPGTNGVPGNDDGGALSSWWVLAAMGLHPVPGSTEWTLGTPRFARVTVRNDAGDAVLTIAKGARDVDGPRIAHAALLERAALTLP